jgi:hypothetical protein
VRSRTEKEWINSAKPTKQNEKRDDEAEQTSVSLSLPSLHPRFTPANLASMPSINTRNSTKGNSDNGTAIVEQSHTPDTDSHVKQSSLLGAYHDTDREEDDPLLSLGNEIESRIVRPSSEHFISTERTKKESDKQKGSLRKHMSEHIIKPISAQGYSRPKCIGNDARGNTLVTSANIVDVDSKAKKASLTSNSEPLMNIRQSIPAIDCEDECTKSDDKKKQAKAIEMPKNCKYFDKATMTWRERIEVTKKEIRFDKVEFRWVVSKVTIGGMDRMSHPKDVAQVTTAGQTQNILLDEMRKSKALQISKTERHSDVTKQSRSAIQGTSSSTKRKRRASVNMDQMKSAINSRNLLACIVCKTNKRSVLLVPCSHLCLCESCSTIQEHTENCPLCACRVTSRMVIA